MPAFIDPGGPFPTFRIMRARWYGLLLLAASAAPLPAQRYGPDDAPVVADDIPRFWKAWERLAAASSTADSLAALREEYFAPASRGLQDFIRARIEDEAHLLGAIRAVPSYYASIRGSTLRAVDMIPEIRAMLRRWAALYPEAQFPAIYLVIGRLNSGGTTSADRILIGTEMYGRTDATPLDELDDWLREVLRPVEDLPIIVAHELFHTQQEYARDNRLLARAIREGVPDFLAELVTGRHINPHVHAWAEPRAHELWVDFQMEMHEEGNRGWLYASRAPGEPNDLGYWMGYRIAKAYYERAADKAQALHDLLAIRDYDAFLAASGITDELGH